MDKNALKDKRRETVIGLLKGMSIKQDPGDGFDKDDVYNCIQELTNLYEKHIEELEKNYEAEIGELRKKYHKYDENNDLYVSLIMEAKKSSNEIINQAKGEVDEILANGKTQIAKQEKQLEHLRNDYKREQETLEADLSASRNVAEAEKAAMRVEIEAEKEKLEAEKNKYRQLIAAMEGEFTEIRTNLLRTSANLDALKAQAEEITPSIEWNVEEAHSVQIPTADIEVEDVVDIETDREESFEETFFKSEVLEKASEIKAQTEEEPAAEAIEAEAENIIETEEESAAEEATAEDFLANIEAISDNIEAADEIPADESAEEQTEETHKPEDDIETLLDEISFDDILEEEDSLGAEEISLDDFETVVAEEDLSADETDEISFEGLEELFKDEK